MNEVDGPQHQKKHLGSFHWGALWSLIALSWICLFYFEIVNFHAVAVAGVSVGVLIAWTVDKAIQRRRKNKAGR
ncbi:hypothetical protein KXR64_20105 [Brucella intermedia]|uniref:hypothetical protein n=1 Tax=Brucella TaxID=234 RepID=UPI0011153128|nr:hypothetical protein [Brucella intermedia]